MVFLAGAFFFAVGFFAGAVDAFFVVVGFPIALTVGSGDTATDLGLTSPLPYSCR